jgi:hypothetical protein
MDLVYDIFDRYMAEKDKLFLFYMVVAMIKYNEKEILEINKSGDEVKFIMFLNKEMKEKTLVGKDKVEILFAM